MTEFSPEDIQVKKELLDSVRAENHKMPRIAYNDKNLIKDSYSLMTMAEVYIEKTRKGCWEEDAEYALCKAIRLGGIVKLLVDVLNIEAIKEKEAQNDRQGR